MNISKKRRTSLMIVAVSLATICSAAPSQAETFAFSGGPLTNLNPAGATINGGFTKFPAGVGLYIQQCIAPVGTARPAICSDAAPVWVSPGGEAQSVSPNSGIAIKVAGSFVGKATSVDCAATQCGLFFRRDHNGSSDLSEDKFLPISFANGAAAQVLPADEVSVTLNGTLLVKNIPSNLGYRASTKIVASAKSGLPITLTSLTPDCTYSDGQFVALKGSGQCALAYSTAGNATTAAASGNFPFILVPGNQKIERMAKSVTKAKPKALPTESTFGTAITYKSLTKNCVVELNLIEAKKNGVCKVRATAPAKDGMWNSLSLVYSIPVK